MTLLKQNEIQVIEMMTQSEELERHGFALLSQHADPGKFFTTIRQRHLLDARRNPAPEMARSGEGYVIRAWAALDYLEACAKQASRTNDVRLAADVIAVIREVTEFARNHPAHDNYHTYRTFAEILGLLPLDVISTHDIELVRIWLSSRFDKGAVVHELDDGFIPKLLAKPEQAREWIVVLIKQLLEFRWTQDRLYDAELEPVTAADAYWLLKLLKNHARRFGQLFQEPVVSVFEDTVRTVYSRGNRATMSWLYRPAIEDHGQNSERHAADACFILGYRESLIGWCETSPASAGVRLRELFSDSMEIMRRFAVFVLDQRWEDFEKDYASLVSPQIFHPGLVHETYGFLSRRFANMTEDDKERTLHALREVKFPDSEEADIASLQARFLTAMAGRNYQPADQWIADLRAKGVAASYTHPDFNSYIEVGWRGPEPSPYDAQELIALLRSGRLVRALTEFEPSGKWDAPSVDGLASALEEAVRAAPDRFARKLNDIAALPIRYQNAVLSGLRHEWESSRTTDPVVKWAEVWPAVLDWLSSLAMSASHNASEGPVAWQLSLIADLLRAGVARDEHAFEQSLLPKSRAVIEQLLKVSAGVSEPADDAMGQAINNPRGRAIEALWLQLLREARLMDRETGDHERVWRSAEKLIEQEIAASRDANFEFSTLFGAYVGNIDYLAPKWIATHVRDGFGADHPRNFKCALNGLGYAPMTLRVHRLLRDGEILDSAMSRTDLNGDSRRKLVERVVLGYLWGEDDLESPRMRQLAQPKASHDIETTAWLLSQAFGEELTDDQRDRARRLVETIALNAANDEAIGALAGAVGFVRPENPLGFRAMMNVARFVGQRHGLHEFVGHLQTFAKHYPKLAADLLDLALERDEFAFDYEDRSKKVVELIAQGGERGRAIQLAEKHRRVPGMIDVFKRLTSNGIEPA